MKRTLSPLLAGLLAACAGASAATDVTTPTTDPAGASTSTSADAIDLPGRFDHDVRRLAELVRRVDDPATTIDYESLALICQVRDLLGTGSAFGRGWSDGVMHLTDDERREFGERITATLPARRGASLESALWTLQRLGADRTPAFHEAVVTGWAGLTPESRTSLLQDDTWALVRDARLAPLLEADARVFARSDIPHWPWHVADLASSALRRWGEFAPDAARALVLEDIRRTHPVYTGIALAALPDAHLDEVDAHFRGDVAQIPRRLDMDKHAALLERYGGPSVLEDVTRLVTSHKWACSIQTALLGYVMRHDRARGLALVARAARVRGPAETGCYRTVLTDVLARHWGPDARALAESFREDPDPDVRRSAGELLSR